MPERKPPKSKYTVDRQIPGAFEGETVTRRRFMTATGHTAGAVAASAFALPALGFALGPLFEQRDQPWQVVGSIEEFSGDSYVPRTITLDAEIGDAGRSVAFVRKRNDQVDKDKGDQYNQVIAIWSACMHLGCPISYVNAAQRFICPCHGGVYDFVGRVAGGPPVRPLDRFYTQVQDDGTVLVGPRYSVNSELRRFSPRDPGEALDGIGQFAFPSRPSLRKIDGT